MKMRHNGTKANPGRDKILCLCIATRMDINEIRRALEISNCAILYAVSYTHLTLPTNSLV